MKIAYVALTRGNLSGGSRKHLRRLVPLLRQHSQVERVDVFVHPKVTSEGEHTWPEQDELLGFRELRRNLEALKPDVIFIPTARLLRVPGIPSVTMVRNMEPLEVPFGGNALRVGLTNVARAFTARRSCRASDRVIAVSDHVHRFLVTEWRIPASRIGTVPHGIDIPAEIPRDAPPFATELAGCRFLFTAGSIRPARGLEDLVQAMAAIPADVRLVVAGSVDAGAEAYRRRLEQLAAERGVSSRILWAGQLDASAMSWCFRQATHFVMTSRAEACPNTVLEAMAHGAVSISTDHPPMPEFFGDTAVYYRQRDHADLGRTIVASLSEPEAQRAGKRDAAVARARQFTWDETARRTIDQLRCAIEGS